MRYYMTYLNFSHKFFFILIRSWRILSSFFFFFLSIVTCQCNCYMQIPLSHRLILLHWGLESCLSHHESSWWFWDCWSLRRMDLLSQEMTVWSFKCSRTYWSRQESSSFTMKIIQLCFLWLSVTKLVAVIILPDNLKVYILHFQERLL